MAIIKCKMCGGDIQRSEDQAYGTCDSCGSTMTFPKVSDEQRTNLFNRANHFRRQGEFDKAISAYESILNQDDTDAEAHWGVVLSRYGIEYVEDPVSHDRVPTCHRVQIESILNDADYLAALEHAPDGYSRSLYEEEAKKIAELQRGILALSSKEKPYDVFICYKETDDAGTRTPDSALAQDVYYQLVQEGYKVFFSRITLEDKLGQQYEPYIFAALNSANVMVVIGTQAKYFNAVWTKNEWSRFLALMKKDRGKLLIPCYKGMNPYDLPEALSMLQSQDMSKIGFIQDLVRGIRKVVDSGKEKPGAEAHANLAGIAAAPGVQSLLRRAQLFLEDGDFKSAAEYADKVLDIDPEYAPAYMARLQALFRLKSENELGNASASLAQYGDYQKAVRFADGKMKPVYLGYNQRILERLEEERRESIYQAANKQYQDAKDQSGFQQAAGMFQTIPGFKDADERTLASQAKAEEARLTSQAKAEEARLAKQKREEEEHAEQSRREAERAALTERERIAAKKRRAKNRRIAMIVIPLAVAAVAITLLITQVVIPRVNYQKAMNLLQNKQYDEAAEAFEALGAYSDSAEKAQQSIYQKGTDLLASKQYDEAAEAFEALGAYSDSAEKAQQSIYQKGTDLLASEQYDEATEAFEALGAYSDSASMVKESAYQKGKALANNGNYAEAAAILIGLKDYKDTGSLITGNAGLASAAATAAAVELDLAYKVGNTVIYGAYEQDNNAANGKEAILWRVLAREGDKALLISMNILDSQPLNTEYTDVVWETCTLRSWLNDDFLNAAFSQPQQEAILSTVVKNGASSKYSTSRDPDTNDKVFLLSIDEAETLFRSDEDRVAMITDYVVGRAYRDFDGTGRWWLCSRGTYKNDFFMVNNDGSFVLREVSDSATAVRPALWLNLESEILYSSINSTPEASTNPMDASSNVTEYPITQDGKTMYAGHHYRLVTENMSYANASEYCESIGGYLCSITSAEEQNFVLSILPQEKALYWLGASDREKEGEWKWTSGESFEYSFWNQGEPNGMSKENFLILSNLYFNKWGWNDGSGLEDEKYPFVCEWNY